VIYLGFKVKWVEDNLGVTRKALRKFEEKGLMPKNEDGQYRDYTDEDIEALFWRCVSDQFGRALEWHSRGQEFDPPCLH